MNTLKSVSSDALNTRVRGLSDNELLARLQKLVVKERNTTLEILPHLAEVDRRDLYLRWGFGSLTEYCIEQLGYCESAASRRVRASRVIRDFPQVYDLLEKEKLTFSAVVLLSRVLKNENIGELLPRVVGKSQNEVRRIIAEYEPPLVIRDQARPRLVLRPAAPARSLLAAGQSAGASPSTQPPDPPGAKVGEIPRRSDEENDPTVKISTPPSVVFEKMYEVRFAADEDLMEMLRWLRSYLSGRFPRGASYQEMFKYAIRYLREREDPVKRAKRREKKRTTKKAPPKRIEPSRHIPQATRDAVYRRDKGRCTFVGSNGQRCNSTWDLEIDHDGTPFGRGGGHSINNLRLLCAAHNRLEAERVYGVRHKEKYLKRE